jgi:thiol-disulfide isomerase/thioredoxin
MIETSLPIIDNIETVNDFNNLLSNNPGLIIIKMTAEWCGPCKMIEPNINTLFENMPSNVQCVIIDIDKSIDVYSFFKKKRVINGVPVILCYLKGNTSFIPDDFVIGANLDKIDDLNTRCIQNAQSISNNSIKIDYSKIKPIKPPPPPLSPSSSPKSTPPSPFLRKSRVLCNKRTQTYFPESEETQIQEVPVNNISKKDKYIYKNKTRKNIKNYLL